MNKSVGFYFLFLLLFVYSCKQDDSYNLAPEITKQPNDITIFVGDTTSPLFLSVEYYDPEGYDLEISWSKQNKDTLEPNINIEGATGAIYYPDLSKADTTIYYATVKDVELWVSSRGAKVIVLDVDKKSDH